MPRVIGQQIAGEQVNVVPARPARNRFDPEEIFDGNILVAKDRAIRPVEFPHLVLKRRHQLGCRLLVCRMVDMLDFLTDDPCRHRIDIEAQHVTSDAVCLNQGRATAHEGIGHELAGKVMPVEVGFIQPLIEEFRQQKPAKQGARPSREPFMDRDDWPVNLLDLLLLEGQGCNQRNIEALLDAHNVV